MSRGQGSFPSLESYGPGPWALGPRPGGVGIGGHQGPHPCLAKSSGLSAGPLCFLFSGGEYGAIEVSETETTPKCPLKVRICFYSLSVLTRTLTLFSVGLSYGSGGEEDASGQNARLQRPGMHCRGVQRQGRCALVHYKCRRQPGLR